MDCRARNRSINMLSRSTNKSRKDILGSCSVPDIELNLVLAVQGDDLLEELDCDTKASSLLAWSQDMVRLMTWRIPPRGPSGVAMESRTNRRLMLVLPAKYSPSITSLTVREQMYSLIRMQARKASKQKYEMKPIAGL